MKFPCIVAPKLDGVRAVLRRAQPGDTWAGKKDGIKDKPFEDDGQLHFFSRNNKVWDDNVVRHLLAPLREVVPSDGSVILDGEFYRHGWPCRRINGAVAVARSEPNEDTAEVEYHVFDSVGPRGYLARMANAAQYTDQLVNVHLVSYVTAQTHEDISTWAARFEGQGYEGAMVRNIGVPYEHKRTFNLLKLKKFHDAEFECTGVIEGRDAEHSIGGRLEGTLGALELVTPSGNSFKCGSGFDDATRHEIWADPSKVIGKLITVKFFEQDDETGVPRFPIFQTVRDYE